MEPITLPAIMTLAQWQKAEVSAKQAVVNSLRPPQIENYINDRVSRYPRWLTWGAIGVVFIIGLGAFIISAGKQIVAYDTILSHLATYSRLSPLWVSVSLMAGILLSEVGAFGFSLASAVFNSRLLRGAAIASAMLAMLANIAVTSSYDYGSAIMTVLAWFMTLFVPAVVLVGAYVGERLILEQLDKRNAAMVDYEVARRQHTTLISYPEQHPEFAGHLRRYWLETYRRAMRDDADQLSDPQVVNLLAMRDFTYYGASLPNFSLLADTASDKPALTTGE